MALRFSGRLKVIVVMAPSRVSNNVSNVSVIKLLLCVVVLNLTQTGAIG
jgi:hypothetical protein